MNFRGILIFFLVGACAPIHAMWSRTWASNVSKKLFSKLSCFSSRAVSPATIQDAEAKQETDLKRGGQLFATLPADMRAIISDQAADLRCVKKLRSNIRWLTNIRTVTNPDGTWNIVARPIRGDAVAWNGVGQTVSQAEMENMMLHLAPMGQSNGLLRMYNTQTDSVVCCKTDNPHLTCAASYSTADQSYFVVGYKNGLVQVFDASTGKLLASIQAHTQQVKELAVQPCTGGNVYIVSAANDGVKILQFGCTLEKLLNGLHKRDDQKT